MTLQSSGSISLNDIAGEFGGSTPHSLSEYYSATTAIPTGGPGDEGISISDFYSAAQSLPPTVQVYVVGGGGGGGSIVGTSGISAAAAGGGGSGEYINETSDAISSGDVFSVTIGSGGTTGNNGGDTYIQHGMTYYWANRGGRGGGVNGTSESPNPVFGGGASSADPTGPGAGRFNGYPEEGGEALNYSGESAGGGGGGCGGSRTDIDASLYSPVEVKGGRGQYGIEFTQGVPSTIYLGYGGMGGVSSGVVYSGGANAASGSSASTSQGYGAGGGGGAWKTMQMGYESGASGSDGVAIIQYPDIYLAPTSLTGTYTSYNQGGYRTYIFTANGTLTW